MGALIENIVIVLLICIDSLIHCEFDLYALLKIFAFGKIFVCSQNIQVLSCCSSFSFVNGVIPALV